MGLVAEPQRGKKQVLPVGGGGGALLSGTGGGLSYGIIHILPVVRGPFKGFTPKLAIFMLLQNTLLIWEKSQNITLREEIL